MDAATGHGVDHGARYERFLLWTYLTWRGISIAVYGPATWEGRSRYRRPRLAAAAWLLMAGEFAWSAIRLLRARGDHSRAPTVWVDTATTCAIVFLFPHALESGDTDLWRAWGYAHAAIHAEAVPFVLPGRADRSATVAALVAADAVGRLLAAGPTDWNEAGIGAASIAFRVLCTSLFSNVVRANVGRLDAAHTEALRASREVALQRARARHRRYLQDRVVGVLQSVSESETPRSSGLRRAANREAARLRRLLFPGDGHHPELMPVVDEAAEHGIDLEVVSGETGVALSAGAVEAIRSEVVAAFGDNGIEAPVRHVVLFVDVVEETLMATLRGGAVSRELRVAL